MRGHLENRGSGFTPRFRRPECGITAGNRGIKPLPLPALPVTPPKATEKPENRRVPETFRARLKPCPTVGGSLLTSIARPVPRRSEIVEARAAEVQRPPKAAENRKTAGFRRRARARLKPCPTVGGLLQRPPKTAEDRKTAEFQKRSGRISTQVPNEYFVNATRKLTPGLTKAEAWSDREALFEWEPRSIDIEVLHRAHQATTRCDLSWRDSLIVAAAVAAGCEEILSEDLLADRIYEGMRVVNPFASIRGLTQAPQLLGFCWLSKACGKDRTAGQDGLGPGQTSYPALFTAPGTVEGPPPRSFGVASKAGCACPAEAVRLRRMVEAVSGRNEATLRLWRSRFGGRRHPTECIRANVPSRSLKTTKPFSAKPVNDAG